MDNLRACLLMIFSMAAFAVEDLFLKWSATDLSPGQVIAMTAAGSAIVFGALARMNGERLWSPLFWSRSVLIRNLSESASSMLYVTALALIPLSVNSALLQASPLVVTMGAALLLGETVGWRRWTAITVGFAGVLIVLRPWSDGFQIAGLLTVLCVVVLSARDLVTRAMPAEIGTLQLITWACFALVAAGVLLMLIAGDTYVSPTPPQWANLAVATVAGFSGYYAVTAAMRLGEVSVVAPFRYTRLIFSMTLAMLFLAERPDGPMIAGSALIILSGLYTIAREARVKRIARASPAGQQPL